MKKYIHSLNMLSIQKKRINYMTFTSRDRYFKPISKILIQDAMESRALDMILRQLIGDDHFTWYSL